MIWNQYKKTAPYVQGLIIIVALALYFTGHFQDVQILVVVATMEIGSVIGAWWAVRLKRKLGPVTLPSR